MPETQELEIIRRCKQAAVSHGRRKGAEDYEPVVGKSDFELYTLRLSSPQLGDVRIFWIPADKNLRVRLYIPELGHKGSRSVLDINSNRGSRRARKPVWHYTERNDILLDELRKLMVLDDLANA